MSIDAALVREQGVTFAVVAVKSHVLAASNRDAVARSLGDHWGGVPVVLMAKERRGTAKFYGRSDLVQFLRHVPLGALPWKSWRLS